MGSVAVGPQVGEPLGFLFGPAPSIPPAVPACFSICQRTVYFLGHWSGIFPLNKDADEIKLFSSPMSVVGVRGDLSLLCSSAEKSILLILWFGCLCFLCISSSLCSSAYSSPEMRWQEEGGSASDGRELLYDDYYGHLCLLVRMKCLLARAYTHAHTHTPILWHNGIF